MLFHFILSIVAERKDAKAYRKEIDRLTDEIDRDDKALRHGRKELERYKRNFEIQERKKRRKKYTTRYKNIQNHRRNKRQTPKKQRLSEAASCLDMLLNQEARRVGLESEVQHVKPFWVRSRAHLTKGTVGIEIVCNFGGSDMLGNLRLVLDKHNRVTQRYTGGLLHLEDAFRVYSWLMSTHGMKRYAEEQRARSSDG